LTDRAAGARAAAAARTRKTETLRQAHEALRTLREARVVHERRVAEMTSFFGVDSLTDVAAKLEAAARKARACQDADEASRDILDALRLPSIEEAEQVLDNADRAALETEATELKARVEEQDLRAQALFAEKEGAAAAVAAIGGDDAVARLEEQRRTTLLEVEDGALRYLKLRLGVVAAEHALRAYRQRHRGAMMEHASEAFRKVSRGAYSGLASQPERDSETMIAVAADGTSKLASQLSKGTRFQLYLALRLAGYREFARLRPPLPFVADDIMETFDEERTEEALRLLADMATTGQVIYLTHHRFVCDIAARVCPGVRMHDLAAEAG